MRYEQVVNMLGYKAKDKITGTEGIITSICFDLYGCIQAILTKQNRDEDKSSFGWIDINRLKIISKKRIMEHPGFERKLSAPKEAHGPAEKPLK